MPEFRQMLLLDHTDTPEVAQLESEQQLVGAAWAIANRGAIADVTELEANLVEEADIVSDAAIAALISLIRLGHDPLGTAFARLRSSAQRRSLGAVYTPSTIVDVMVSWIAERESPSRVIDPGSGSGRFAVKAGLALPEVSLVAVELDPLAALLTRANLTATGLDRRSQVIVDDYRQLNIDPCEGVTAFLGNPPYVRHHQIEPSWKEWLRTTAAGCGWPVSGLSGLHMYFFLATFLLARPGDVGAFVTSSEWLDVNYGRLLRTMLTDGLGGESIHVIDPEAMPFENAATTAAVTCFRVGSEATSVVMRQVDCVDDLADLTKGRRISKRRLSTEKRWSPLLVSRQPPPEGYVELGEMCKVHRGAVTGANATWITKADNPALPEVALFPAVTKARELFSAADGVLTSCDELRTVIDLPVDLNELDLEDRLLAEEFLKFAEQNGARSSYIARHRNPWWSVRLRSPAPILATYMARRPPAFVRNPVGARHVNIAHGIYPREPMAEAVLDSLAESLRASVSPVHGRTYAGGLTKFEPSEMQRIPVPSPALLAEMSL